MGEFERPQPTLSNEEKNNRLQVLRGLTGQELKDGFCDYLRDSSNMNAEDYTDEVAKKTDEEIIESIESRLKALSSERYNSQF